MNLDEARAICHSSTRVQFCSEPGFDQLVEIDYGGPRWIEIDELQELIENSRMDYDQTFHKLCIAALLVLRDNIARAHQQAAPEADCL